MKKKLIAIPALLGAIALGFSGCAQPPGASSGSATTAAAPSGGDFKACMVSDSGGFDDKSFNQTSYKGLTDAQTKLGIQIGQVESSGEADFAPNIQSMVTANCNIVITVGFLLSDATMAAAQANPNVKFAIVDDVPEGSASVSNLKPLAFNTAESAFQAGYLAAAQSQSGKVGTFGGMKIPSVTVFMDGYAQGVAYYNDKKGKSVQVVGWNDDAQDGLFLNGFEDVQGGKRLADQLASQGADIIMPVAGPAGQGALQTAQDSGGKVSSIWVDTDGYISAETYRSTILTSVVKGMDLAVEQAITDAKNGTFNNTEYVGTLANGGTSIAPFHDFDSKVTAETKSELDQIKADISSGTIEITSVNAPK